MVFQVMPLCDFLASQLMGTLPSNFVPFGCFPIFLYTMLPWTLKIFLKKFLYLCLWICLPECFVGVPHVCHVPEDKRGCCILWNLSTNCCQLRAIWVLGKEPRSFGRVTSALPSESLLQASHLEHSRIQISQQTLNLSFRKIHMVYLE